MSDVSYLPVLEMSAENSRKYCCPKPGKSRLSGQVWIWLLWPAIMMEGHIVILTQLVVLVS